MTEVPLPPLPILPASNTERIAWVRWATEAVLQERERAARACEAERLEDPCNTPDDIAYDQAVKDCAAAIRKG